MRKLENFMNWLTDMDWGWWPVVSLRPEKDRDIDNKVLLQISPIFGSVFGLLGFLLSEARPHAVLSITSLTICMLFGVVVFFVSYKVTFAYFWNQRARRLRGAQINDPLVLKLKLPHDD